MIFSEINCELLIVIELLTPRLAATASIFRSVLFLFYDSFTNTYFQQFKDHFLTQIF